MVSVAVVLSAVLSNALIYAPGDDGAIPIDVSTGTVELPTFAAIDVFDVTKLLL